MKRESQDSRFIEGVAGVVPAILASLRSHFCIHIYQSIGIWPGKAMAARAFSVEL